MARFFRIGILFTILFCGSAFAGESVDIGLLGKVKRAEAIFQLCAFKFTVASPKAPGQKRVDYFTLANLKAANLKIRDIQPGQVTAQGNELVITAEPDDYLGKGKKQIAVKFSPDFKTIEELTVSQTTEKDGSEKHFLWKIKGLSGGILKKHYSGKKMASWNVNIPFAKLSGSLLDMQYSEKTSYRIVNYSGLATEEELKAKMGSDKAFNATRPSVSLTLLLD